MRIAPGSIVSLLLVACAHPTPLPGCAKDVDCKGTRICERGACVEPLPERARRVSARDGGAAEPIAGAAPVVTSPAPSPVPLPGASPMFHVDRAHRGRSPFTVSTAPPRELARIATSGTVYTSPAILDDGTAIFGSHDRNIYAATFDEKQSPQAALRWTFRTGDMVWCSPALAPAPGPPDGAAAATSSAVVVYAGSDDDKLYALDAGDGHLRWSFAPGPCRRTTGANVEGARCDVDGVTVGFDATVYLVADGAYALRPDGTLRWRFPLPTHCHGAPALGPDGTIYFGCQDERLYALAPDGQKRWDFRARGDVDSSPAVAPDGTIYFGSDDDRLYALTPEGAVRFALKTGDDVRSSPAIGGDGTIYVGSFDKNVYAVHPDGVIAWTFSTADRVLSSATIDAAGTILIGSEDDRLYALAPDGKLLWSVLFDGDVDSTPAIGRGGTIYVGSDDKTLHVLR